ncbi:MAG TPA: hypothetical protein VHL58_14550, partial [Thermoanaerobaculia bacterium]|nr:hypothetical protein [Thermoanaerobaculia bacterium]
ARTDIFALGAVLYEMATARRAFEGKTRTSLIAAIVTGEPRPISEVQPLTPPAFEHVLQKCLAKEPDDRWQSAHDIAEELQWIRETGSQAGVGGHLNANRSRRDRMRTAALASLLIIVAGVTGFAIARARSQPSMPIRLTFMSPELAGGADDSEASGFALSPDGTTLAFIGVRNATRSLFVRPLNRFESRPLPGTEGASFPFWSPDSRNIGFFAGGKMKRIAVAGNLARWFEGVHCPHRP